jgi:hypothetical protein
MNRFLRTALVLAAFACASSLLIVTASAQSVYGSVFGTVSDKSGAVIPNATITVTDEAKGTVVTVTSNGSGDYSVPHLIPDVYDLKVVAKGFTPFETKGIKVEADTAPRIDPTLDVGSDTGTTVTVSADAIPELKTDKADVATVFDQQQISSLPVGDQNFTNLQLLVPGAQLLGWSHAADENPQASKQIMVNGQAFAGTAFELDGTDNEDPILGIIVVNPTMDAVAETKITTQNFDAELGKAVSAFVTAQTKSGTNHFHGDAYDFRTSTANLARDPFTQTPGTASLTNPSGLPAGLKNRMGGAFSGPIMHDRLFFFGDYEGQRQKVGTSATDTLPTSLLTETCLGSEVGPSGIPGCDFSEYATALDAKGIIYDTSQTPTLGTDGKLHYPAFPGNVIPASRLAAAPSQPAMALLTMLEPFTKGIAETSDPSNVHNLDQNFKESGSGLFNSDQWTVRSDYTVSEKIHAFGRFTRFTDILSGTVMFGAAGGPGFGIGNYGGNSKGANDSLATGMDIAVSPTVLTDFRLGYYRYNVIDSKHDQTVTFADQLGIPGINNPEQPFFTGGAPGFVPDNVPGGSGGTNGTVYGDGLNVNRCNCPLTQREDQGQIVNNWTFVRGNHTFKVGADLRYARNLRVPSDNDRAGQLNFSAANTSDPNNAAGAGGLGFATMFLGNVTKFNRYVSSSTNNKEFQKRTFFYGQDTWRVSKNLTLNLGLRWELYFPEAVNGPGNGSLLDLSDGYLHVAGIGPIPSDMGWKSEKKKMFAPRLGLAYQIDDKTVIRAGYGRSFDIGVFGSIFGHVVTQNLPVLSNQQVNAQTATGYAFTLDAGPPAPVPVSTPSDGLLPNQGYAVNSRARPNPLRFPEIDAWNLAVQRAITPTMSLTLAYVGNKGTHNLGDGSGNTVNPQEQAITLPGQYSQNGQPITYVPGIAPNLLKRYYGGRLPACGDSNYISLTDTVVNGVTVPGLQTIDGDPNIQAGQCGWTNDITYYSDDLNTEFNALQVTLAQQMWHGLAYTANFQWASAFSDSTGFATWSHAASRGRDSNVREHQLVWYGSYDLPFGKGKQLAAGANRVEDLIIGGFQLSSTLDWAGGLPYTLNYSEASNNIPGSAPSYPSANGRMKTHLTSFKPNGNGIGGTRTYYQPQTTNLLTDPGTGIFTNPGLDTIGNVGRNTYFGPSFFTEDVAISKSFSIWESVQTIFRMDADNVWNHINPSNPGGNIEQVGTIGGEGGGCVGNSCGPRQLNFSLRVQF